MRHRLISLRAWRDHRNSMGETSDISSGPCELARPSLHAGGGFDLEKTSLIPSGEEIGGMFSPLPAGAGAADG